ncbi:hypothetical protein C8R44DRAFT_763759 [Mycena epipterygia]|nr:hypothetical protein C8R44DRAFT_763759 [Mycena epipterygia]
MLAVYSSCVVWLCRLQFLPWTPEESAVADPNPGQNCQPLVSLPPIYKAPLPVFKNDNNSDYEQKYHEPYRKKYLNLYKVS